MKSERFSKLTTPFIPLAISAMLFVVGCGQGVYQSFKPQLAELKPGETSPEDLQRLIPATTKAGQSVVSGKQVDAFELEHRYIKKVGDERTDILWFYFVDNKLVKWGKPGDWPVPADITVDVRRR